MSEPSPKPIFISDFDGTLTKHDFFRLAVEKLLPPNTPDFWAEYRSGEISHFEAMRRYYAAIRVGEVEVRKIIDMMEPEPQLGECVSQLRNAGWQLLIVSNGCDWYIKQILAEAGVQAEVLTSPSHFVEGQGLLMELPTASPFFSPDVGILKSAVVQKYVDEGRTVAFAGNGFTDLPSAKLVKPELRFAREDLAESLSKEGLPFRPFERWGEVTKALVAGNLS